MRKATIIVLVLAFAFGFAVRMPVMADETSGDSATVTSVSADSNLEKIASPDQIKLFKNIVKKGNSLFGVRKEKLEEKKQVMEDKAQQAASSTLQKLEKILAPQFINLYEKITKIGSSLWGYKKQVSEKIQEKVQEKTQANRMMVTSEMSSCVIDAVKAKDATLAEKNTAYTNELNAAIAVRTTCQETALGSTENQFANLDACGKAFQTTTKASREKAKNDHDAVWKTYRESLAGCASKTTATSSGELMIEDGGGSIVDVSAGE